MRSFSPIRLGLALVGSAACVWSLAGVAADVADTAPRVVSVRLAMPVHPIAADHLERSLAHAAAIDAAALVIELDTPGGSLPATRRMVQAILGSEVPVVVWVGPGGAQAASAGFFLLLAADAGVMAPGTNTGSAHPVAGSGEDLDGELGRKVEEDTLALARSLAEQRGRDIELAQAAVRDSRSFTADEALAAGLIDLVAADVSTTLDALDGQQITTPDGTATETWRTAAAVIETRRLSAGKRLLAALAHPQIAGLLMALGMLGLYVEISNPGLILPGTFGAIALVLGAFALSVLPINTAGLALLALALVFFVAETQVPTFGVLTVG
ncbi:MAG: ATP-dependent Clp protease proteolytic subunit, partial [Acidobacteriota bacterium]